MHKTFIDVDDTILDWKEGIREYMNGVEHKCLGWHANKLPRFGLSEEEFDASVRKFNESEFFGNLNTLENSRVLARHLQGTHLLSSCGSSTKTKRLRENNIVDVLSAFDSSTQFSAVSCKPPDEIDCLPLYETKVDFIRKNTPYGHAPILVDDSIDQIKAFIGHYEKDIKRGKAGFVWVANPHNALNLSEERRDFAYLLDNMFSSSTDCARVTVLSKTYNYHVAERTVHMVLKEVIESLS